MYAIRSYYAHVVLPAASFAEKDGTFTNAERRVQRVRPVPLVWMVQMSPPASSAHQSVDPSMTRHSLLSPAWVTLTASAPPFSYNFV